ncbi:uncharacterized protein C8Q71DRAFT_762074 [Rhodofomes roseus]|uniref:Secreted protein n=1 Tax=Rhodofomes roseus TaxID=34475 RepID=A0ABQ8KFG0_9APHY|nr:uncharacterized protein C8Q71DRAFT_762074 [Rhodofomes roseus]KAH9836359.1 hypothetical protein C8Q71DRAFT_762074 [Rhodofomes roseus]
MITWVRTGLCHPLVGTSWLAVRANGQSPLWRTSCLRRVMYASPCSSRTLALIFRSHNVAADQRSRPSQRD